MRLCGSWSICSGLVGGLRLFDAGSLSVNLRISNFVTLSIETSVALSEDDDAFDEAPDAVADENDVSDDSQEAEDDVQDGDAARKAVERDGNDSKEEAASGEADVDSAAFRVAKIPIVSTEGSEKNTE